MIGTIFANVIINIMCPGIIKITIILYRDAAESYSNGVLSQESYEYGKSRAMVSLKICVLGWGYEFFANILTAVSPSLLSLGLQHQYYIDAILLFLGIPFIHLMNDEETKGVIVERNWYQGFRHMVGFQNQIAPQNAPGNQNN